MPAASPSPQDDLALLRKAALEAGAIAKAAYEANDAKIWDKGEGHPVTDADIAVNDYLGKVLQGARPDYGWLSEETQDDKSRFSHARSFVVDPIDGTRAFIERSENFTVSIAVIEDGAPIAGAVFNPIKNELYSAAIGTGAWLNDAQISCPDHMQVAHINMVGYPRKFRRLDFPEMNVFIANSMAYRIVMVASGAADATVAFTPKSDWDLAAATLIATESGAVLSDLQGKTPRFNDQSTSNAGVICAGPHLHGLLLETIKPHLAQFVSHQDFGTLGTTQHDRQHSQKTPQTQKGLAHMSSSIQLLHIVIGGELVDPMRTEFKDLTKVDFVGAFANGEEARAAWKNAAQRTVDNAHMRYFILHAHELLDPDGDGIIG